MKQLTFEHWEETYKPIRTLETYGEDWETVKTLDPRYVFTVRDGEGTSVIVTNGIGWANRLEYIECMNPWDEGENILVTD